ncbi:hypothetical protein [Deinococcus arenicola]|uniref:Right handed beta helix domain-containing protein n=1 Tax=Deinococcus arenicola TaxID=2994950 RepID=A0ABU4DRA1_9DEIO|nr:hypothetical protein [Deinococcus sp. ZS9-10]MDV6374908.1 hypothetical protein [Deinococcus sp. ZS9-10]
MRAASAAEEIDVTTTLKTVQVLKRVQISRSGTAPVMSRAALMLGLVTLALTACAPATDLRSVVAQNHPSEGHAYEGPLVITQGGTYRGNWQSLDPAVPAISIRTREPVVIENSYLRGRGNLIRGEWVNLTIRNTTGYGLNPLTDGLFPGRFMNVEKVLNLDVQNNTLIGTSGIYVNYFNGDSASGQTIKILKNKIKNVDGRYVDASGKLTGKRYNVQAIQFNAVRGVAGVEIAWNEITNEPEKSGVEENINMYVSSGTPQSSIQIHNNFIDGAYGVNPRKDRGYSGGGIMLGDGSGNDLALSGGYVDVYDNQVVRTSNQGIAIAGGHHQRVYGNRIVSSGRLPSGEINPSANVGIYVWNNQADAQKLSPTFFNNSVFNNLIGWARFDASGKQYYNNLWTPSCLEAAGNVCKDNQAWPVAVSQDSEREELARWKSKMSQARVSVGVDAARVLAHSAN